MDDLNPADFTALQPYFDSMRVKRGLLKKVLDDASGLFPRALVLFKDNGNICSTRNVTSVPSIHETYPFHRLRSDFLRRSWTMPRVCFPVRWSSLRTMETSAPRATSLRFRPSMKLTPFTASDRTS